MPIQYDNLFRHRIKSYKMILVLALLDVITDRNSRVPLNRIAEKFQSYLAYRENKRLPVDIPPQSIGATWGEGSLSSIRQLLQTPLEALSSVFEQYEDGTIGFTPSFVEQMDEHGLHELRRAASQALDEYWARFNMEGYRASGSTGSELDYNIDLRTQFLHLMNVYLAAKREPFAGHPMHEHMRKLADDIASLDFVSPAIRVKASVGQGNWATVPWIALMDTNVTTTTQEGVYVCYLFADDMSACYLAIQRGVTKYIHELGRRRAYQLFQEQNERDREEINFAGMHTDDGVHLSDQGLGRDYEASVIAYVRYSRDNFPTNDQFLSDLQMVLSHYKRYVEIRSAVADPHDSDYEAGNGQQRVLTDFKQLVSHVSDFVASQGFTYDTGLLSNFLISMKVRPFVILAGISGTGKSKLVSHVARALGATSSNGRFRLIPVRPDWSDPADLLGYRNLQGDFVPGPLTEIIENATNDPENPYFVLLDEMNLARVEYYLSDVLSVIETQRIENGQAVTDPILQVTGLNPSDAERYGSLIWPKNLILVGTVNMDETTHPFSKKVLDRASTIEFNHVDLARGLEFETAMPPDVMTPNVGGLLRQDYFVLRDIPREYRSAVERVIGNLTTVNTILRPIGAQIGYRVRDVVSFFVVYSLRFNLFTEAEAFDIQLLQKILPRLQGSTGSLRRVLVQLLEFCVGRSLPDEPDVYQPWLSEASSNADARYPQSAAKIAYMLQRMDEDGFTSFWIT
jgi:5-methylcytosine-specific restriction enzyme B